jgi:hypothetical protein
MRLEFKTMADAKDATEVKQKLKRKRVSKVTDSAKKRRKIEWSKARVHVGSQIHRWRQLKNACGIKTDAKFAKHLLDRFVCLNFYQRVSQIHVTRV